MSKTRTEIVLTIYVMFLPHGVRAVVSLQGYNKIHREWVLNWLWVWLFTPRDLCCRRPADHHDTGINTTWVNEFQHHWATHILSCHLEAGDMLQVFAFTNILSPVDLFFFYCWFLWSLSLMQFLVPAAESLKASVHFPLPTEEELFFWMSALLDNLGASLQFPNNAGNNSASAVVRVGVHAHLQSLLNYLRHFSCVQLPGR